MKIVEIYVEFDEDAEEDCEEYPYKVIVKYDNGTIEIVDETDGEDEANYLVNEYALAYGV